MLTHFAKKVHKDLRNMCKFDHSLLILRKNFENSDRSMYAICVGLGKFCSQKNYAGNKNFTRQPVAPVATDIMSDFYLPLQRSNETNLTLP